MLLGLVGGCRCEIVYPSTAVQTGCWTCQSDVKARPLTDIFDLGGVRVGVGGG